MASFASNAWSVNFPTAATRADQQLASTATFASDPWSVNFPTAAASFDSFWPAQPPRSLSTFPASAAPSMLDRKSTRLNSSHLGISYAVVCLKKNHTGDQPPGADWPYPSGRCAADSSAVP